MKCTLNLEKMRKKDEAHSYLKEIFSFPDYYGKNLDAFADLLDEKLSAEKIHITVAGENLYEQDNWGYARGIIKVLKQMEIREPELLTVDVPGYEVAEE